MNRKQLGILLVLLAALGGAGLVLSKRQNASWSDAQPGIGKKLLGDFPVNEVSRIVITEGTNTLNLVKRDDLWRVSERGDYPANYSDISGFLLKARDLKVVQTETVGPSQMSRLQLAPAGQGANSAVTVEFKGQGDKLIKTLLLGKKHLKKSNRPSQSGEGDEGWPDGRYVQVGASTEVAVISDSLENIAPKPAQWLDKDFAHVEKARSVEVVFPSAANSWKLARETESGEWKLADSKPGEELDSTKIAGISSPLSSPSFTDILLSPKPEQTGLDKPAVVTIGTFDEFTYVVKIGQKTNDEYPLTMAVTAQIANERPPGKDEKPEDKTRLDKEFSERRHKLEDKLKQEQSLEKWTYVVASWTIDPFLKERSQLLTEKKEEPKAGGNNATNAIEKVDEPKLENQTPPTVAPKE